MSIRMFDLPFQIFILVFAFLAGTVFASFFTCMGERIAKGRDWVKERSTCDHCGHVLGARDLIPVFSYLSTGGKCRYCGAKIPVRCLVTEVLLGIYYVLCVLRFGISMEAFRCMALSGLLLGLSIVDLEIYEIPDGFIVAGIVLWVMTLPFLKTPWRTELIQGLLGGLLIGGGMLVLSLIFDRITGKESLGGGDIKLFFMTGLFLKPACGLLSLIVSCMTGLCFVLLLKKSKIPFGPAISLAVCITLLYGSYVVEWYLGLFL